MDTVLIKSTENIYELMIKKDWNKLKMEVHSLKGSCGYIYAHSLYNACKKL